MGNSCASCSHKRTMLRRRIPLIKTSKTIISQRKISFQHSPPLLHSTSLDKSPRKESIISTPNIPMGSSLSVSNSNINIAENSEIKSFLTNSPKSMKKSVTKIEVPNKTQNIAEGASPRKSQSENLTEKQPEEKNTQANIISTSQENTNMFEMNKPKRKMITRMETPMFGCRLEEDQMPKKIEEKKIADPKSPTNIDQVAPPISVLTIKSVESGTTIHNNIFITTNIINNNNGTENTSNRDNFIKITDENSKNTGKDSTKMQENLLSAKPPLQKPNSSRFRNGAPLLKDGIMQYSSRILSRESSPQHNERMKCVVSKNILSNIKPSEKDDNEGNSRIIKSDRMPSTRGSFTNIGIIEGDNTKDRRRVSIIKPSAGGGGGFLNLAGCGDFSTLSKIVDALKEPSPINSNSFSLKYILYNNRQRIVSTD